MSSDSTDTETPIQSEVEKETEDPTQKQILSMPPLEFFNKSFEAMWYQAEVLHKREVEKWDAAEKKWEENEKRLELKLGEVESNMKAGIFKFTKDILDMISDYETQNESNTLKVLALLEELSHNSRPLVVDV